MGHSKSSSREIYSNTGLPQETRKISNKQPNLLFLKLAKVKQTKTKACRRKEIIKIKVEINKMQAKKKRKEKINETKRRSLENIKKLISLQPG